jgi:hypothetical protein
VNQLHVAAIRVLADVQADDAPRNSGPDFGKASPLGLLVLVLLLIGVMFLVRSMNRHLRNLPDSFDTQNPALGKDRAHDSGQSGAAGTDRPTLQAPDVRSPDEPDG